MTPVGWRRAREMLNVENRSILAICEEAILWARDAESDEERWALPDLARTWTQAGIDRAQRSD